MVFHGREKELVLKTVWNCFRITINRLYLYCFEFNIEVLFICHDIPSQNVDYTLLNSLYSISPSADIIALYLLLSSNMLV